MMESIFEWKKLSFIIFLAIVTFSLTAFAEDEKECWETGPYEVMKECHECSTEEYKKIACRQTGYAELLKCTTDNQQIFRACPVVPAAEIWKFWKFQITCFVAGSVSLVVVVLRMRALDSEYVERIHRQISSL